MCELKKHLPAYVVAAGWSAGTVVGSVVAGCASALFPGTGSQLDAAGAVASVLLQPATVLTWHLLPGPQTKYKRYIFI